VNKVEDIVLNASQNYANAIGISIDQLIDHVLDLFKKDMGKKKLLRYCLK